MATTTTKIPSHGRELLYGLKDSERYLYHYTRVDTAVKYILPSNTLRLSPYTQTNDPKETKVWDFDGFTVSGSTLNYEDYPRETVNARMNEGLKTRTNVLCLSSDGPLTGDHLADIYHRGWCKPRMWAQYADNHRGVCLVFEREKLEAAFKSTIAAGRPSAHGKVKYVNRSVLPDLSDPTYVVILDLLHKVGWEKYIQHHLRHSHPRLFFEKNGDWEGEREYRFIAWGGTGAPEFVNFGDALRGIMFGANADEDMIWQVYKDTYARKILIEQLSWKRCAPWYDLGKWFSLEIRYREEQRAKAASGAPSVSA